MDQICHKREHLRQVKRTLATKNIRRQMVQESDLAILWVFKTSGIEILRSSGRLSWHITQSCELSDDHGEGTIYVWRKMKSVCVAILWYLDESPSCYSMY